jgi:hypothetical protein
VVVLKTADGLTVYNLKARKKATKIILCNNTNLLHTNTEKKVANLLKEFGIQ